MTKQNNRRGYAQEIKGFFNIPGLSLHYRDRKKCIIYVSENGGDIFVDLPGETIGILRSDQGHHSYKDCKSILHFVITDYLIITKVLLRDNRQARRWFNKVAKANLVYGGKPFSEFFTETGAINWDEVEKVTGESKDLIAFLIDDEDIGSWKGYNPFTDPQLGLREWIEKDE